MKNSFRLAVVILFIPMLVVAVGCAPKQIQSPPEGFETTCIQGTVWYSLPTESTPVCYPNVAVTAWVHGTEQGLADTKTDEAGNYCIEVPLGDFKVDLRVWGLQRHPGTGYVCSGSEDNIDLGTALKKCGDDCISVDITTECRKFIPKRGPH